MQNFGPIRRFEKTYFENGPAGSQSHQDFYTFTFDLKFQNDDFAVQLMLDTSCLDEQLLDSQCLPKFKMESTSNEVIKLFDGLLNYWSNFGLKPLIEAEVGELESFLREKNHVPVLEKKDFQVLDELRYGLQLLLESMLSGLLLHIVKLENEPIEQSRDLEKLFNRRLNLVSKTSIQLLDQDSSQVIFRFQNELDDGPWKDLWVQVIQKLANQLKKNNARQWVDKPWQ